MLERHVASRLETSRSALLLGPRQVGKSTLLRGLAPDWSLNLASPATFRDYVTRPERLSRELEAVGANVRTVFIDEVQRVPALLDAVQVAIDEHPGRFRFLLSGSSARKLRRGHVNLLPGRVHALTLSPLLASELGPAFDVDKAMTYGTLPGIYLEPDERLRAADLRSYTDSYLREEIQAEALVRDLGAYSRLLELIAASSGRVLNLSALGADAGVKYETARRYLDVLEDTLVTFRIPAFAGSDRASLIAHPRVYLFDLGVRNALLRRPLTRVEPDRSPLPDSLVAPDERGLLFEHLVAFELVRRIPALWPEGSVSYFRTKDGAEVDFVVEFGRERWAIEVKASTDPGRLRMTGFDALEARVPITRRVCVCLAERAQRGQGGVDVLPFMHFVGELPC